MKIAPHSSLYFLFSLTETDSVNTILYLRILKHLEKKMYLRRTIDRSMDSISRLFNNPVVIATLKEEENFDLKL